MEFNGLSCLQIRGEREIQQQMMLQEEETLEMRETFSSLQQEVELKTKKLRRVRWLTAGMSHYAIITKAIYDIELQ